MIQLTTTRKLDFDLMVEILNNGGFDFSSSMNRKWVWWGERVYTIKMEYMPKLPYFQHLLEIALKEEDYYNAQSIQKMINIKKNEVYDTR